MKLLHIEEIDGTFNNIERQVAGMALADVVAKDRELAACGSDKEIAFGGFFSRLPVL